MKDDKQSMHHFRVEDAVSYGVDKAVILSNLRFWLTKKRDSKTHSYDGYYWVYNTAKELAELFPYFTQSKVQRLLKQLEEDGVLLVGNYNKVKYDRTRWYSLNEFCITDKQSNHDTELNNGSNESVEPIPDTKHLSKPNINTNNSFDINITFDKFWDLYDYKKNKADCNNKWLSMTDDERQLTMDNLALYIKSTPDKAFRKYPINYLNDEMWNDEVVIPVGKEIAHNNNIRNNDNVFSASHKEFEPIFSAKDSCSSNHTKDDEECNLEALGLSSVKTTDKDDCTNNSSTLNSESINNNQSTEDILSRASQVHWSELKSKGLLKKKVNPDALAGNTDADSKVNEFLARYGSKGFCKDIA